MGETVVYKNGQFVTSQSQVVDWKAVEQTMGQAQTQYDTRAMDELVAQVLAESRQPMGYELDPMTRVFFSIGILTIWLVMFMLFSAVQVAVGNFTIRLLKRIKQRIIG